MAFLVIGIPARSVTWASPPAVRASLVRPMNVSLRTRLDTVR